jgi:hypothetical protein
MKDLPDCDSKYVNNVAVSNALMNTPERTMSGIKRKQFQMSSSSNRTGAGGYGLEDRN